MNDQQKKTEKIVCLKDYVKKMKQKLDQSSYGYFSAGADQEHTLRQNQKAFLRIKLCPRVLVDMTGFSMKTRVLGYQVDIPFGIAPLAMQKLIHPEGQILSAQQAFSENTIFGHSMLSTTKPCQITEVNPTGLKIHQLYLLKNAEYTQQFIKMVEKNGFHALAITVDTQTFGKRRIDKRNKFQPEVSLEVFKELNVDISFDSPDPEKSFIHNIDTTVSWKSISYIKKITSLKIILKGIVAPEDVDLAHEAGVDAIWISNHGGRQLDTAPATIEAVPGIRHRLNQLKSKMQLYVDGGVWKGTDVFKCLALGADFVFLGRGLIYSIVDGKQGIENAFRILKKELKTAMMLSGTPTIDKVNSDYLIWKKPYSKL